MDNEVSQIADFSSSIPELDNSICHRSCKLTVFSDLDKYRFVEPIALRLRERKDGTVKVSSFNPNNDFADGTRYKRKKGVKHTNKDGITGTSKSKIKRYVNRCVNGYGYANMVTLTFKEKFNPCKELANLCLANFRKRFNRYIKKELGISDVMFLWVLEAQKNGVIHYHVIVPYFIKKNWLNNAWNKIQAKQFEIHNVISSEQKNNWLQELTWFNNGFSSLDVGGYNYLTFPNVGSKNKSHSYLTNEGKSIDLKNVKAITNYLCKADGKSIVDAKGKPIAGRLHGFSNYANNLLKEEITELGTFEKEVAETAVNATTVNLMISDKFVCSWKNQYTNTTSFFAVDGKKAIPLLIKSLDYCQANEHLIEREPEPEVLQVKNKIPFNPNPIYKPIPISKSNYDNSDTNTIQRKNKCGKSSKKYVAK